MKNVKWGLIGCGDISRKRVAPGIRDAKNSSLVAVNRFDYTKAESFAKEFGANRWVADWKDLISDSTIDAVYIATPVYQHAEQTIAAAKAGKHVLCEKPMAIHADDADKMIAACKANNVKLGVAFYRHFFPAILRIKKIISGHEIGSVIHIQSNNFENFNRNPGDPRFWLLDKKQSGGGPMMDMGCHRIEVFINIMGPIKQTTGFNDNTFFKREVEDLSSVHFKFESGATGILTSGHAIKESQDTLDIYGTEGSIHVPVLNAGTITIITEKGTRVENYPNHTNVHLPLIENFVDSIIYDLKPAVPGDKGREITRILDKIYKR